MQAKLARIPLTAIDDIRDDFASLDDWEDRYRYVIELGHSLEPLGEAAHNDANKVRGCVSQVWLQCERKIDRDGRTILHYSGDSELAPGAGVDRDRDRAFLRSGA